MFPKLSHLIKLVPALIGGTYITYPFFLPTMPKDIEGLLYERDCFIAVNTKDSSNRHLLACTSKKGKSLYFFFHDSSSSSAIPVKYLKLSDSDTGGNKKLDLGFTWGSNSTLSIPSYIFEQSFWLQKEGEGIKKELDLTNYCKKYKITATVSTSDKKILKCEDWNGGESAMALGWPKLEKPPRHIVGDSSKRV